MIIFLEATNMIIKRLEIKNLHGIYNYNVSFNDDLTFIFGENGCGKTTILDIVSSIVTGRLYNLFSYDFDEIVLSYRKAIYVYDMQLSPSYQCHLESFCLTVNICS